MRRLDFAWVPGGKRDWTEILPEPWSGDPYVAVVMAPGNAGVFTKDIDGARLGMLRLGNGSVRGLQVLNPSLKKWPQHDEVFREFGVRMADPDYIGPMSGIPSRLLMRDQYPLVFLRDQFSTPFLPLRQAIRGATELNDSDRVN